MADAETPIKSPPSGKRHLPGDRRPDTRAMIRVDQAGEGLGELVVVRALAQVAEAELNRGPRLVAPGERRDHRRRHAERAARHVAVAEDVDHRRVAGGFLAVRFADGLPPGGVEGVELEGTR